MQRHAISRAAERVRAWLKALELAAPLPDHEQAMS